MSDPQGTTTKAKDNPSDEQLVEEVTAWAKTLVQQGVFKNQPNDSRMLGEVATLLKETHPSLTVTRIDQAIKEWIALNHAMVRE